MNDYIIVLTIWGIIILLRFVCPKLSNYSISDSDIRSLIAGIGSGAYITIVTSMATIIGSSLNSIQSGEDVFHNTGEAYTTLATLALGIIFTFLCIALLLRKKK